MLFLLLFFLVTGPGHGSSTDTGYSAQMQSRAVDTRATLEIKEGQPRFTTVGRIPTKPGYTYRFNEPPKEFMLDAKSGEIKTNQVLDRESLKNDRYDLVVLSSQPTYPIEVRIVVLDINDNAPQFPEPVISVQFSESAAAGTRLLLDAATDLDTGVNGVSDDYRIIAGNKNDKFRLIVTANPTGETSYLHLETTGKLDRESQGFYTLNISARDGGIPPKFGYLQVNVTILDVNDNPPIFDHSDYIVSLNESVPPGTPVLQVMATDNDFGDNSKITYYLADTEHQFSADPETGVISTTETLECPQQNCAHHLKSCPKSCVFTVFARDHGSPRQDGRTYVTVNLVDANDHDPVIKFRYFPSTAVHATVDENAGNGSVVAAVSVVDSDEGLNGATTVRIVSGNALNHFRLDYTPSFDIVRVNGVLDREEISKYNLTVVATDKGTPPRTATNFLIIHVNDVNDHEPVFEKSEYSAILSELSPPGTYVAGITATDEDTGVNAQIYYTITAGNQHNWFNINPDTGLVTTSLNLDREIQGSVELNISARDGGPNPKWAYTQLKVIILDENDEAPQFSQNKINVSLSESAPENTLVAMLTASDNDQGTNGSVIYYLHPSTRQAYDNKFALDSLTGQLTTKTTLDREQMNFYELWIVAKDQGLPPQSSTATVYLNILDVNDNSPEFYPLTYYVMVQHNLHPGAALVNLQATDRDSGENSMISYTLESGDNIFKLNPRTGVITLNNNHLTQPLYKLKISARDHGGKKSTEDATVEVIKKSQITDYQFDNYNYDFKLTEDYSRTHKPRQVGLIKIKNQEPTVVRYSIIYGDPARNFAINQTTGLISSVKIIDREDTAVYTLTIIARSDGFFGKTQATITIEDLNDNKPIFQRDKLEVMLPENAAVGQEVYLARARDADSGINSRVTYTLTNNPDDQFRISESTGVVYLNRPVRHEPGSILNLEVSARDSGEIPLSSRLSIKVIIQDVNDHTPIFDHTSYETSLLESTPVNERFFALSATDSDLANNGLVQYTISEGNGENKFGIFPDGYLYVRQPLDREDKDYYSLTVTAGDSGNPRRSSVVPVVIHVIDENDNQPQFTNQTFVFQIRENQPPDSFVGKLTATDKDIGRNAELIFSLSSSQSDFSIDPKNGFIKTLHLFDREELESREGQTFITLEATVSDNGYPRLKDKVKVNIYITDVNDNPPKFLRTPYKVQVSENSAVGTHVIRLYTSDLDEGLNGDVYYSITAGDNDNIFNIEEATGVVILNKPLDRESVQNYQLTITARDAALSAQLHTTTSLIIDITDENDNSPEFTQTASSISVVETTPIATDLIQFHATDNDLGVNSDIQYTITAGNRKDTFHINPESGILSLHKPLDYEELTNYQLNITASDNGNPKLSSVIQFTILVQDSNDNPPQFPSTAIVRQIREGIPIHTPIVTVTADDPDSGPNGKVLYKISAQEPEDEGRRHFGINPVTGVINTLLLIDRESVDTFRLTVVATDQAEPPESRLTAEKLVTVIVEDVNDNAPIFVSMNAAMLPRDNKSHVMTVFARDLDSATNGLVTYELSSGASGDLFELDQSSGELKLKHSITGEPTYKLSVKATDEAVQNERKSSEAYLTIISASPREQGPGFRSDLFTGSVYENEPPGTSILRVEIEGESDVEFYVTNVTGDGVMVDRLFDVDTKMGVVATAVVLDREAGVEVYEVEVWAVVVGAVPRTSRTKVQITVLDKNDSPPSFKDTPLHYSISEDLGPGQPVATVKADDPDTIGELEYTLIKGDDGHFVLDKKNGILSLVDSLDRETKDVYKLTVRASDGNQYTDSYLTVQITDTNDNPPVFVESAYSFDIPENAARGSRVGQVKATDPDLGVNAHLTYTVISDWANDVFSLNPQTGVFTLTSRLDYEEVQHYILVVQAQDAGHPALSSTLTVYCNVLDLNDNAPLFDPMSYSNEIFENVSIATPVVTVSATDLDSGDNGRILYTITAGDDREEFQVTENGTIMTKNTLDRESQGIYNLIVTATDQAMSPEHRLSSTVQVTIILKDVNDMSPEFITPNQTSVAENIPVNTVVMAVKAVDKDEGRNGYIEYSLTASDPVIDQVFSLGPVDGLLRVSGRIDREIRSNYTVIVTARDRGDPPRATQSQIFVTVLDENDNSPVFDPKQYSASIAENASIGASVLQVSATDIDDGLNGRVRYSISSGDTNRDFSIAEDTGVVRVAKNLNYERKARYVLTVRAEDCAGDINGDQVRSDTAEISISVSDINDNPPTFLDSPYLAYVMENIIPPNGGYVVTVQAYDADTPPFNNLIRYFIKEGETDVFRINASSGEISLLRALDREMQDEYVLSLVAMDTGSPPLTGTGTVKVLVQDVNDHSPEFKRQSYYATVAENSPLYTWVLAPVATDKDVGLNSKIRYSLLGDKIDRFKINQDTGVITTNTLLDREETDVYYFTLMAQDCSATEPRATAVNLTITISDDNDNSPVFSKPKFQVYVSDKTKAGEFVFGAKATDQDIGDNSRIVYTLAASQDAENFTINQETGVIKSSTDLLLVDSNKIYNLKIGAQDCGKKPRSATTEVQIFLKPEHLFPRFSSTLDTRFTLPENVQPGAVVAQFKAQSPKKGVSGNIKYAIAGGNLGDALIIDRSSGQIQVAGTGLDYESAPQYEVWIEARDSDNPALRSVLELIINVTDSNDNAPVMNNLLYNASVMEEEVQTQAVVKVQATDLDSGVNGQITYKLTDDFGAFEIDADTGEINTIMKLDREEVANYELIVEALDGGVPQLTGTSTVLVSVLDKNDNPPRFTRLFSVNVTENAEIGSFVIHVTSSDQDIGENANATYSFTENPGAKFKIDPITGNVTVTGHLDREQQDEYLLKVAAVDGAWKAETPLTITIQDQNDNAPEFEHSFYSFNFPELQRDVVFVGQVIATDRDKQGPNSVISYSMFQPSDLFTVDPASGEIYSKRSLRYRYTQLETSPENVYALTIIAIDNGKPPMSSECLVTVNVVDANNNAPKFDREGYLSPVPDDAIEGQTILRVTARDEQDFGINAEILYTIIGGNGSDTFNVDKNSGWISLMSNTDNLPVGRVYSLKIRATDRGVPPLHDESTVTLVVAGDNRFAPVFTALSYQVIVPENEPLGSTILTVSASDSDQGPNGMIKYQINNERKEFAIDAQSGAVTILQPLDYDSIQEYRLNITAEDLGFKSRSATAMLTITLTDINDNEPVFNQTSYNAYIFENSPPDTVVYKVQATDIDSPKNAIIIYAISGDNNKFTIHPKSGQITSKLTFNYEQEDLYTLTITASNPDSVMSSTCQVLVHIKGVNEFYPRFIQPVFHFDVSESTEVGTKIGTVLATDQDSGEDGKVYYLFVGSSNDRGFIMNTHSGTISVSRNLDRETQSRIVLTVMAKNSGGIRGNDTDEAQVIVTVQDGNDPPEFVQTLYELEVSEGVDVGTKLVTVKAVDKDVRPQNNQFSYSIIAGNVDQVFKIEPQSGQVEVAKKLDRETIALYDLTIGAIDTGVPPQTGTATVKINVLDINDNGPVFASLTGKVLENEPVGTKIMTLLASDPDLPPNGAPFAYKLIGGKHGDYVRIDKHTGLVQTTRIVDRETVAEFEFLVEVEDSGNPRMKSEHLITVQVLDVNDSPSSSRSVHVLVYGFNNDFPIGKIADVHPNDADIIGDYKCRLLQGSGILTIEGGCGLYTSRLTPGQGYSLSVSGNDGRHADVISTVTVEFVEFNNDTVSNSVSVKISNLTSQEFLTQNYRAVLDALKNILIKNSAERLLLYSLHDGVDGGLELTLAVKSGVKYITPDSITEKLVQNYESLRTIFTRNIIIIAYSACQGNRCENNGICTEELRVKKSTTITDSPNIIITSPLVVREFICECAEGFRGETCHERQDPCQPNPCKSSAQCRRQGFNFHCVCPSTKDGRYCELERGDLCSENPCQNGGSCRESPDGSSFFCLCRPGYRGNKCEVLSDSCRPNPCLHGGQCVSLKPGYKCSCADGRYGRHCEKTTFGFQELSFMTFAALDAATNDVTFIFATTKRDSLLVYNYGAQTGGRSDFVALELVGGRVVFSFGGARTAVTSVSVGGKTGDLADGGWYKIIATRNGRVVSLSVASCTENGDVCEECRPGDSTCYADDIGPAGTLNFNNQPLLIGGLNSADPVLERPGQIHSDDLIGCVHSISINGRLLNLSHPIESSGIQTACTRRGSCAQISSDPCLGFGQCVDRWSTVSCTCGNNIIAPNCNIALQPITLTNGAYVEFPITKKHKRMQLLENLYGGSTVWRNKRSVVNTGPVAKSVSLLFRTVKTDGVIFYSSSNKQYTSVELIAGQLVYISKLSSSVNMSDSEHKPVTDGQWHNLTLNSHSRGLEILLDSQRIGEELDSAGVHDFLDPYLTYLSLGGVQRNLYHARESLSNNFEGCLANFTVNNEIQPFNGSGTIFSDVIARGKVLKDCNGHKIGLGIVAAPDPLSIGITLVIVFFVVLLVAILVSFVVFRLRKQHKEKSGVPVIKQNGTSVINPSTDNNILNRGLVDNSYHENGDVIRGITGHSLVGPELLTKKYKERDLGNELPRPQRPDIIEREVTREKVLPPQNHNHDHSNVNDLNSEPPEHYDLENASSIAPSDIDIVYHYKGYREAGGIRKYKATPPPVAGYHHKHQQAQSQHRHSGYPHPRGPPVVTSPGSRGHQSTPLARLSPSSEMSAQQPRILTLHDISGKPLQSALLATTSSSGGVGKDNLHSNSERSLNSPVMSQLSGQSSSNGRKAVAPVPVQNPGLTAEDIERLNARPRTSSLVSTLDAVSSSSEAPRNGKSHHLRHSPVPETHHSSTTTDESGNDSFTCSEIEYDNASLAGDKYNTKTSDPGSRIIRNLNQETSGSKSNLPCPAYDGFDSSYRGSMSTLVASDDELGGALYRPSAGSPSGTGLGWDYLLNWGPNFESLAGVFKDIAELPDSVNVRVAANLRLANAPKPSEEYV